MLNAMSAHGQHNAKIDGFHARIKVQGLLTNGTNNLNLGEFMNAEGLAALTKFPLCNNECSLGTHTNNGVIPFMSAQSRSVAGSWKVLHVLASAARDFRNDRLSIVNHGGCWIKSKCANISKRTSETRRARCI
jgi:hypothetical protein